MAVAIVGEEAEIVLNCFNSISMIMMVVTQWVIKLTPIGVIFLIAGKLARLHTRIKKYLRQTIFRHLNEKRAFLCVNLF
jgi:Na+/H+-dicarboxylate symporter